MSALTTDQLVQFDAAGVLAVEGVLTDADLAPVEAEYEAVLDAACHDLVRRGHMPHPYAGIPFDERYIAALGHYPDLYEYLNISLPLHNGDIDPARFRCHTGPALFRLLRHPAILDLVEAVIGGEITSNPIQQVRLKPPRAEVPAAVAAYSNIGRTTWHQDHGAAMDEAEDTTMLTVWVAITDATEEMGCLVAAPETHLAQTLTMHCPGGGLGVAAENYIPRELGKGKPTVTLPVPRGSVILLSKWVEHAALDNVSDRLRWSFDLRYQRTGQPTGRPAFPSFVARSRRNPATEMTDPADYAAAWERARVDIITKRYDGPVFEQDRWVKNASDPLCA